VSLWVLPAFSMTRPNAEEHDKEDPSRHAMMANIYAFVVVYCTDSLVHCVLLNYGVTQH
jgi:hypothetical protein